MVAALPAQCEKQALKAESEHTHTHTHTHTPHTEHSRGILVNGARGFLRGTLHTGLTCTRTHTRTSAADVSFNWMDTTMAHSTPSLHSCSRCAQSRNHLQMNGEGGGREKAYNAHSGEAWGSRGGLYRLEARGHRVRGAERREKVHSADSGSGLEVQGFRMGRGCPGVTVGSGSTACVSSPVLPARKSAIP